MNDFVTWQKTAQAHTEAVLQQMLPETALAPQGLHKAMRYAALDGGNAFVRQLGAAVNQAGVLCAVFHRFFGNGVVVVFIGLAEVGGVGIRQRAFEFHPQEGGGGVEPAGKGDADFLVDGEGLQNGAHDIPSIFWAGWSIGISVQAAFPRKRRGRT